MVRDISKMKQPEEIENKLIETTGTCKYCNNLVTIKVPADADEEERDKIASSECGCKDARKAQDVGVAVRVITDKINKRYAGLSESARNGIIALLKPVGYGMLDKATVKVDDNTTIKVYRAKNGLNCTRTIKEDDNIDEWSID